MKIRKIQNAMYNSAGNTCQKTKVTKCHVQFRQIYLLKKESHKMACTTPSELPVKKRKSQNAMYNAVEITCQKTKVTKCHVQPRRNYLSKNESHKMPCTTPPKLPVKKRKSQNAMYNPVGITCEKREVTKCHVQFRQIYLLKKESHKMACTTPVE